MSSYPCDIPEQRCDKLTLVRRCKPGRLNRDRSWAYKVPVTPRPRKDVRGSSLKAAYKTFTATTQTPTERAMDRPRWARVRRGGRQKSTSHYYTHDVDPGAKHPKHKGSISRTFKNRQRLSVVLRNQSNGYLETSPRRLLEPVVMAAQVRSFCKASLSCKPVTTHCLLDRASQQESKFTFTIHVRTTWPLA